MNLEMTAGIIGTAVVHLAAFMIASAPEPPRMELIQAPSSIEIHLVAHKRKDVTPISEVKRESIQTENSVVESDILIPREVSEAESPALKHNASEEVEVRVISEESQGVRLSEPQYKNNPPPAYPKGAMLRGWQGRVILMVDINSEGKPVKVYVEHSSGFSVLDKAALKAVKGWEFIPAKNIGQHVFSRSRVPVNFVIRS